MRKRNPYLEKHPYAIWQSKDGKWWYTTFPDQTKERGVRQIKRSSKAEIELAITEYWMEADDKKTIRDVYEEWSQNRLTTKRIVYSTYINVNCAFNTHFSDIADKPFEDIQPLEWCDFLEREVLTFNLTKVMFGTLKSMLLGMVKWAFKRGYIEYSTSSITDLLDISEKSYRIIRKEDEEEVYSEEETPIIVEYLSNRQDTMNLGLLLMFLTGIRVGELQVLQPCDFVGNTVKIHKTMSTKIDERGKIVRYVKETPKTYAGIRDVIVPNDFKWVIDHFASGPPDKYIFKNKNGSFIKTDTFNKRLKDICSELGIPYRSSHKIRKTYGSILLDNGVDKRFVIEQMGHAGVECTENFYHRDRKGDVKKGEIIDKLDDFYRGRAKKDQT